jgi:hypothetical protein
MKFTKLLTAARAAWVALILALGELALAQEVDTSIDKVIPPGKNYEKAGFRMWLPAGVDSVLAAAVLMPRLNGDGGS